MAIVRHGRVHWFGREPQALAVGHLLLVFISHHALASASPALRKPNANASRLINPSSPTAQRKWHWFGREPQALAVGSEHGFLIHV